MKKIKSLNQIFICLIISALFSSCNDHLEFDYVPPTVIEFSSANIIQIEEGVTSYTVTGKITSTEGLSSYSAHEADNRTGKATTLIDYLSFSVEENKTEHEFSVTIDNIDATRCILISASDPKGLYEQRIVVKITPSVIFTDAKIVETGDYYYGCFFATWHLGRTYPLRLAVNYPQSIDFSFGYVVDAVTGIKAPAVISPDRRKEDYGLSTYEGVRSTKFALTDMTMDEYNAITEVDDTALRDLDPTKTYAVLTANRVYSFLTQDGKKGLLAVISSTSGDPVHTLSISAKVQN